MLPGQLRDIVLLERRCKDLRRDVNASRPR